MVVYLRIIPSFGLYRVDVEAQAVLPHFAHVVLKLSHLDKLLHDLLYGDENRALKYHVCGVDSHKQLQDLDRRTQLQVLVLANYFVYVAVGHIHRLIFYEPLHQHVDRDARVFLNYVGELSKNELVVLALNHDRNQLLEH